MDAPYQRAQALNSQGIPDNQQMHRDGMFYGGDAQIINEQGQRPKAYSIIASQR